LQLRRESSWCTAERSNDEKWSEDTRERYKGEGYNGKRAASTALWLAPRSLRRRLETASDLSDAYDESGRRRERERGNEKCLFACEEEKST
jgi:hypothetical protein